MDPLAYGQLMDLFFCAAQLRSAKCEQCKCNEFRMAHMRAVHASQHATDA
jgi:hypothetical protein